MSNDNDEPMPRVPATLKATLDERRTDAAILKFRQDGHRSQSDADQFPFASSERILASIERADLESVARVHLWIVSPLN